jgi:hypothetical protein
MNILLTLAGLTGFCLVLWDFSHHLPPAQVPPLRRWFTRWMLKGLLTPVLLWTVFNAGVSVYFPPLMPAVEFARMNGHGAEMMEYVVLLGLFVVGSYWAAITVAWLLAIVAEQVPDRRQLKNCLLLWSALLAPLAILIIWAFGWRLAGFGVTLWLLPMLQQVLTLRPAVKTPPIYSRAIAAINFDKYKEAEKAVIEELESCEDDFDGWMMLAELYADQFHDLPGAMDLVRQTCANPNITPSQFAVAHHRLADWQLKWGQDPDAARAALAEIGRHYPGSHLEHMARLRMNQLPASREEWIAQQSVKKISLPTLRGSARNFSSARPVAISRDEASVRSQQCVLHLQSNPDDIATREELARLWAEELGQVEMGVEQLELLLSMRGHASAKAAEWLGLLTLWHLRYPQNLPAARAAMERLIRLYPKSPQAIAAQRRMNLLDLETKMRQSVGALRDP